MECKIYDALFKSGLAAEAERFFVNIFSYGNYSFKEALSGWDGSGLQTLLAICQNHGVLRGAAMALYDVNDPRVAIFGPIAVDEAFRNCGVGGELTAKVLEDLDEKGTQAVYIGVKVGHSARNLYKKLGFRDYSGVVMSRMREPFNQFERDYFRVRQKVRVRKISWADYPKFQALLAHPCRMKTFDWRSGYLSSKYVPVAKFLGVFPEMMEKWEKGWVDVRVLTTGQKEAIVGIAKSESIQNSDLDKVNIDFVIHDNFLGYSDILLGSIIKNVMVYGKVICSECFASDGVRKAILEKNQFCLNSESKQKIPDYGRETVQIYKYMKGV